MRDMLVGQLENILADIREQHREVLHYSAAEPLNEIFSAAKSIDDMNIISQLNFMSPLRIDNAGYTFHKLSGLLFCERLISILRTPIVPQPPQYQTDIKRLIPITNNVFIIHGHDHVNMMRLQSLLKDRFQLVPIILSERPDQGRALIEKFEEEAEHTAYAFAIITPDDEIKTEDRTSIKQARPNVIFEIGWFYGRLGRNRVCILMKKGAEIHSDLAGMMRIEFIESVSEKLGEIEIELNSAGLWKV
jgi:hypothetical protein